MEKELEKLLKIIPEFERIVPEVISEKLEMKRTPSVKSLPETR